MLHFLAKINFAKGSENDAEFWEKKNINDNFERLKILETFALICFSKEIFAKFSLKTQVFILIHRPFNFTFLDLNLYQLMND